MKIAFLLLVCYVLLSEATLKHLKAKLKLSPLVQPVARYIPTPLIVPESVPVAYSSPVSTYSTHTSTYSTVPHYASSYSVYRAPSYSVPVVYKTAVTVPIASYRKPVAIYEEPVTYEGPAAVAIETSSSFGDHFIEGHYSAYPEIWNK